ncbi:hypothetical protein BH23CHL8_BH23CHL8_10650 [soil metagenome]
MRTPTAHELEEFFRLDGWTQVRSTGHVFYQKELPSGELLESHRSFGRRKPLGPSAFKLMLSMQIKLSEAEFWDVLRTRKPAHRPSRAPEPMPTSLPSWLSDALLSAGVDRDALVDVDEDAARRLLDEIRSRPHEPGHVIGEPLVRATADPRPDDPAARANVPER